VRLSRDLPPEIRWTNPANSSRATSALTASGIARANLARIMASEYVSREQLAAVSGLAGARLRQALEGPGPLLAVDFVRLVRALGVSAAEVLVRPSGPVKW
jgi:hypothetical protein